MKRILIPFLSLFISTLAGAVHAASTGPNILFLFVDDQRADTISALGNGVIKTPGLDRLVHSGMAFDRACVPFDAPHDPYIVPPSLPIHYDAAAIQLPPNFLPRHPWDNGKMTVRDEQLFPLPRPQEQVREMIAE